MGSQEYFHGVELDSAPYPGPGDDFPDDRRCVGADAAWD